LRDLESVIEENLLSSLYF